MKNRISVLLIMLVLSGCIGSDFEDDPIAWKKLKLVFLEDQFALLVGNTAQTQLTYINKYGIEEKPDVLWQVQPSEIATVDSEGKITALAPGQGRIIATVDQLISIAKIVVVADENSAAYVEVTAIKPTMVYTETSTVSAVVRSINNIPLLNRQVIWKSSNENILTVAPDGLVNSNSVGYSLVTATVDGVASEGAILHVDLPSNNSEMTGGYFRPAGDIGFVADGCAIMRIINGDLTLEFLNNFRATISLEPSVYLTNHISATEAMSKGIEVGQLTSSGAQSWNISMLHPGTSLNQYRHVVLVIKSHNILFGHAYLN